MAAGSWRGCGAETVHRVFADKAQEAVLAPHVVRLLEEDTNVILALLKALGAVLAALK